MLLAAHPDRPFCLDDLLDAPDDGYRREVLDGALVVIAAPAWRHQDIVANLLGILRGAAPDAFIVLPAPVWQIGPSQIPEPDLVVVQRCRLGELAVEGTPELVVEVLSPSNRGWDLVRKREIYAEARCPSYWIVDPAGADGISVTVLELDGPVYRETARLVGETRYEFDRPFSFSLRVSSL